MKILIVSDAWYPQTNGVVNSILCTNSCLKELGHEVIMLTPDKFRTIPCPSYPEIRLSVFPKRGVQKFLQNHKIDIIHIATEGPLGIATRQYAIKNKLKFTTAFHTKFPDYIKARIGLPISFSYRFLRWFHKYSNATLAPTNSIIEELNYHQIGSPVYWPRGVETDIFKPFSNRKPNKDLVYLYVGRIAVEKNIEAFLSLKLKGRKIVVGDGPLLSKLESTYPDVTFLGKKSKNDLPEIYNKADVFVFPSRTDTFGLVLLEAMACGVPVAAFPAPGPIDVIGDSKAGYLSEDLNEAVKGALKIPRNVARDQALKYSWLEATRLFLEQQVQIKQ